MELTPETKGEIIKAKITQWQQQLYSLQLDAKVAKAVEDDKLLENIEMQVKRVLVAIETLEKELG